MPLLHTSSQGEMQKFRGISAWCLWRRIPQASSKAVLQHEHGRQVQASCDPANIGNPLAIPLIFNILMSSFWCNGIWECSEYPLQCLFSKDLFTLVLAMSLFRNKINIRNHHSMWLVFSLRGRVSISPSCGESAAAVISHYRASL